MTLPSTTAFLFGYLSLDIGIGIDTYMLERAGGCAAAEDRASYSYRHIDIGAHRRPGGMAHPPAYEML